MRSDVFQKILDEGSIDLDAHVRKLARRIMLIKHIQRTTPPDKLSKKYAFKSIMKYSTLKWINPNDIQYKNRIK